MPVDMHPDVLRALGIPDVSQLPGMAQPPVSPAIPPVDSALPGLDAGSALEPPQGVFGQLPIAPVAGGPAPHDTDLLPLPTGPHQPAAAPGPPAARQPPAQAPAAQRAPTPDQQLAHARDLEAQGSKIQMTGIADETDANRAQAQSEVAAYEQHKAQVEALRKEQARIAAETQKVHAQKQAYADAAMHEVDNYKVDQGKYAKEMGLGGMAGWGIAMILSGIGDSLQHKQGPNPVTQMLLDKMKQSVQLQFDERDQLKEKGARAAHDLDKYDAFSKDRMAQTQLLEARYEKQLANMIQGAAVRAKDPLAKARGEQEAGKLLVSSSEKAQKAGEAAATNEIAKGNLQVSRANLGVSQFSAKETQRHNLATEGLTRDAQDREAIKLDLQGRKEEAKLVRERGIGGEMRAIKDANGKTVGSEVGLITNKRGDVWIPNGTDPVVTEFQKGHEAALRLLSTIDEIRKLGPGWLSDKANSQKLQEMKQQMADARLEAIKYHGLGVPTGHDIELAEGSIGTDDPTRWKDSLDGLNKARGAIVKNMNISMKARGLDKEWDGPLDPLSAPTAAPSPVEKALTTLKEKPDENPTRAYDSAFNDAYKANGGDIAKARVEANLAAAAARNGGIDPRQQQEIDTLKAQAIGGDAAARDALADAAKAGGSKRVKELAAQALSEIDAAAKPVVPVSSGGPSYDPMGYDPQSLVNRFQRPPPGSPTIPQFGLNVNVP